MWELKCKNISSENIRSYITKSFEKLMEREDVGFKETQLFESSADESRSLSHFYQGKKKLIVVGLGGSSLGAKALCAALYPDMWSEKIEFLDNVDAFAVDSFLQKVKNPEELGWVVISKSGSTMEVLSLLDYCYTYINQKHQFSILKNMVVITEKKESPLRIFADKNNVPSLTVPETVGGRFSVFTSVGFFPLGFLGISFEDLAEGYTKALEDKETVIELSSQLYESIGREELDFYCFYYCDRLAQWSKWTQQLWSESLAKSMDRKGNEGPWMSRFIPFRGASDQHSILQQIMEGREKKFACLIRVNSSEQGHLKIEKSLTGHQLMEGKSLGKLLAAEADATEMSLNEIGIHTLSLSEKEISAQTLSYLMTIWMLTVGTLGEAFDINAFNQPGVESGKALARRVLSQSH